MSNNNLEGVIAFAIQNANITHPDAGYGTTQDKLVMSNEQSLHLARAIMDHLEKEKFQIIEKN